MRLSNFELLRLVSMFMVLIVHSNFQALGTPTSTDLQLTPTISTLRIILQSLTLVCVNIFILISGWFGIRFSYKGIIQLLFQTFFFLFGIYFICIALNIEELSIKGIGKCLMLNHGTWFIKSYLCLYIIAPILNSFINSSSPQKLARIIILFYSFQFIWGWGFNGVSFFEEGYSTLSFIGLYLLARYIHLYPPKFTQFPRYSYIIIYTILSLLTAFFLWISILKELSFYYKFWSYNSPIIICASLALFLFFSKLKINSKYINKIAISSLAIYLSHFIIWNRIIVPQIQSIAKTYDIVICCVLITILLIVFSILAITMDKVRIYLWNLLSQTRIFQYIIIKTNQK